MSTIAINTVNYRNVHSQPHLTTSQSVIHEIIDTTHHSCAYIARTIGVSTTTMRNLVSGKVKNPTKETWDRLFRYYCYVYLLRQRSELSRLS